MEKQEAYPITYSVLGLLAFMGPMSGYDLKRAFDQILSPMWGAAHSQIYKELRRMNELEWVTMQREEQEDRPDRKIYQITAKGREALANWQGQPTDVLQLRDELLLKLLFGAFAPPGALARNVRASIAYHEQRLLQYRTNMQFLPVRKGSLHAAAGMKRPNPYAPQNEEDPYITLIARFAASFEETYLRWLYETLDVIEGRKDQNL
jgi:PadR family transcriptional regulator, regulatory protein AphA